MRELRFGTAALLCAVMTVITGLWSLDVPRMIYPAVACAFTASVFAGLALRNYSSVKILLDDERIPVRRGWWVVRNADQFTDVVVRHHDRIQVISFDHDLGHHSESGKWCLKWLVNVMLDFPHLLPNLNEIIIHSGNRVGGEDMISYAGQGVESLGREQTIKITWLDSTVVKGHVTMPKDFDYSARE